MPPFCPRCGREAPEPHPACREALVLEPPRFCDECGRRLRVQVFPDRVDARCSEHGPRPSGRSDPSRKPS